MHPPSEDDHAEQQCPADQGATDADHKFGAGAGFDQRQHQATQANEDANPRKAFEDFGVHVPVFARC